MEGRTIPQPRSNRSTKEKWFQPTKAASRLPYVLAHLWKGPNTAQGIADALDLNKDTVRRILIILELAKIVKIIGVSGPHSAGPRPWLYAVVIPKGAVHETE